MSKRFRTHAARRHPLQAIIAHGCCGVHRALDVPAFEQIALLGGMGPHSGQAVGLQFCFDGERVGRSRLTFFERPHLTFDSDQLLYVMPNLVRQHIRLGKLAGSAEALLKFIEETEINVDLLVCRTIKRSGRRAGSSASRRRNIAEQHQFGMAVTRRPGRAVSGSRSSGCHRAQRK